MLEIDLGDDTLGHGGVAFVCNALGGDKEDWLSGVKLGEVVPALVGFPAVGDHLGDCDG